MDEKFYDLTPEELASMDPTSKECRERALNEKIFSITHSLIHDQPPTLPEEQWRTQIYRYNVLNDPPCIPPGPYIPLALR